MALSIKTAKADRLARTLAQRTGESMTQVVETALEQRLQSLEHSESADEYIERVKAVVASVRQHYAFSHPIAEEWRDWMWGDTPEEMGG